MQMCPGKIAEQVYWPGLRRDLTASIFVSRMRDIEVCEEKQDRKEEDRRARVVVSTWACTICCAV